MVNAVVGAASLPAGTRASASDSVLAKSSIERPSVLSAVPYELMTARGVALSGAVDTETDPSLLRRALDRIFG